MIPTSTIPEIQARIDIVSEVFANQTEEDIFWLRWQGAITEANRQRINSINFQAPKEILKKVGK